MSKKGNVRVEVNLGPNVTENPYRKGTFKRVLMDWALLNENFTKDEFLKAAVELKQEHGFESRMPDPMMANAWWNEFYNKHEVFVDAATETPAQVLES